MTFSYEVTLDDYAALVVYCATEIPSRHRSRQSARLIMALFGAALVLWGLWLLVAALRDNNPALFPPGWHTLWFVVRAVIPGTLGLAILANAWRYPHVRAYDIREKLKKQADAPAIRHALVRSEFQIEPDGYRVRTDTGEMYQTWPGVYALYVTEAACYIFNTPCTAVILPRRVANKEEWAALTERLRAAIPADGAAAPVTAEPV